MRVSVSRRIAIAVIAGAGSMFVMTPPAPATRSSPKLPAEEATLTYAPNVPAPIARKHPALVIVHLDSGAKFMELSAGCLVHP